MTAPDDTVTFAAFARLLGVKASAVTALRKADRLVLTPDGKRVQVAASRARMAATADPSKAGVVDRHAATRAARAEGEGQAAPVAPAAASAAVESDPADDTAATAGYQHWRERTERAKALAAERDNALAEGKLMDAGEVTAAIAAATTTLRTHLERLPAELAPSLAATADEGQVRAQLTEAIEQALEDLARKFQTVGRASA